MVLKDLYSDIVMFMPIYDLCKLISFIELNTELMWQKLLIRDFPLLYHSKDRSSKEVYKELHEYVTLFLQNGKPWCANAIALAQCICLDYGIHLHQSKSFACCLHDTLAVNSEDHSIITATIVVDSFAESLAYSVADDVEKKYAELLRCCKQCNIPTYDDRDLQSKVLREVAEYKSISDFRDMLEKTICVPIQCYYMQGKRLCHTHVPYSIDRFERFILTWDSDLAFMTIKFGPECDAMRKCYSAKCIAMMK